MKNKHRYQTEGEIIFQKKLFRSRIYFALAFCILLLLILLGRMTYLQWVGYSHYQSMAEGNRISVEPLPPVRGRIYDRNHALLADNQPIFTLKFSKDEMENLNKSFVGLQSLLPNLSEDKLSKFYDRLNASSRYRQLYLPYTLSEQEAARFAAHSYQFPGVTLVAKLKRTYPYKGNAVHVLGYVGKINQSEYEQLDESRYAGTDVIGKLGIEKYYEQRLHGKPGIQQIETNARGRVIRKLETIPATPGEDIQLTLDIRLQRYIENLLDGKKAAVVVTEPDTGEILAFVSSPTYDPNLFVDGISQKNYQALLSNPKRPLINRVINGQYPPGSTVKPFIALSAIENNIISPNTEIHDPGFLEYQDHRYRDWKRRGHGLVDMRKALVESCDTYFYKLSLDMGIDLIHSSLTPFGFGHTTEVDLQNESSGILPSRSWKRNVKNDDWYNGETIITSIGQGFFLATPLQLAKATSILANRGEIIHPKLFKNAPTSVIKKIAIKKKQNWDKVIQAMEDTVHTIHGTAHAYARGLPFKMAGKTGTAQVFSLNEGEYNEDEITKNLRDHSLFVGFAPVDKPIIAISVIIENSTVKAAPVAIDIAKYYLEELANED